MLADPGFWLVQGLNSLQLAMLLFLLSVGLTVIFGLMNFVNLAHGSLYALGALIGYSLGPVERVLLVRLRRQRRWSSPAIGAALYATLIDRLRFAGPMNQVLVTFGLIFVLIDVQRYLWGSDQLGLTTGLPFRGAVEILGEPYPAYRIFIIAVGLGVFALLYFWLERTRLGAEIRAGVDDAETARCLGIDVERTFFLVFLVGCALAGLAGVIALPAFPVEAGMGVSILVPALIVVVIGGLGSLKGAMVGALLIGATITFGQVLVPALAGVLIHLLLVVALLVKPEGLFPVRE